MKRSLETREIVYWAWMLNLCSPLPRNRLFKRIVFSKRVSKLFQFFVEERKKGKRKKDRIPLLHRSLREIDRIFRLFGSVCLFVFLIWLILSVELFNSEK